jgi:hypothetical protein
VKAPYVFDTNSVSVLRNYYPDQFPSFWKRFDAAVSAGEVVSCRCEHFGIDFTNLEGFLKYNEWTF